MTKFVVPSTTRWSTNLSVALTLVKPGDVLSVPIYLIEVAMMSAYARGKSAGLTVMFEGLNDLYPVSMH